MLPLPPQIDRYEIKSLIGRGGMGDLYLARDPNTNRLVAIKLLNATLDSSELRERFAREARALAALNHPNIVNIYDTGEFEDSPFIVMEYVRGETLAEMIKRRATLSLSQKLKLMAELCAGLAQAHEAGIIHRDIKPANLMMDQQGRLKILDFGIARVAEGNKTRVGLPLTQVNMTIGTPGYMSPEQIEDGEVDHRSDIFAVGAVCYELLSYNEAFSGTNTRQIENKILQTQPPPLAAVVPGLDPEIDEIVLRALKKDPNKRYQDAATFEKALDRLRLRLEPSAPGMLPYRATPPPPQARAGSREPRADAAYQRALVAYQGGAPEAARRFAVEALAEEPSHAGARALLARLDPRARKPAGTVQSAASPEAPPPTAIGTSVSPAGPTMVSAATIASGSTLASSRTVASGHTVAAGSPVASAPTIIVTPGSKPPSRGIPNRRFWDRFGSLRERFGPLWKRESVSGKRESVSGKRKEPVWARYGRPTQAVAVLGVIVGIVVVVILLGSSLRPAGQLLTIAKPTNGTILTSGIRCGTRGVDCSVTRPNGDAIELIPEPDAGFAFVGYTGDCAPGGRTVMTAPRTCGATFAPDLAPAGPLPGTHLMTIAPVPVGGTIEAPEILCGTKGTACSVSYPAGVPVTLHFTADAGFTFMGFLGDCVPVGQTQMSGPRTCSATFAPIASVSAPPTPVPPSSGARGGRSSPPVIPMQPPTVGTVRPVTPLPSPQRGFVDPAGAGGGKVVAPPSAEEFAKSQIQDVLKKYCEAYEAIDPAAVKALYPNADLGQLRNQLNRSRYKSVQCKFADPVFLSLDPAAGTTKVQADVKRIFEHTAVTAKPQVDELIATITLSRPDARSRWYIDAAAYRPKPK